MSITSTPLQWVSSLASTLASTSFGQPPPPPPSPPKYPPPARYPYTFLLDERRGRYLYICVPMYEASVTGDWKSAEIIIKRYPNVVRESITENGDTPLHVAASIKSTKRVEEFVKNLVKLMQRKDLEIKNENGNTALSLAAGGESVNIVEIMINKNRNLLETLDNQLMVPLQRAVLVGNHDIVGCLYHESERMSGDYWVDENRGWVLLQCMEADYFDIALTIVKDWPQLSTSKGLLDVLAQKPDAFRNINHHFIQKIMSSIPAGFHLNVPPPKEEKEALKLLRIISQNIFEMPKDTTVRDGTSTQALFVAAKMGNIRFVIELIRKYPHLKWSKNDDNQSIFHVAVLHHQRDVYNLLYDLGSSKELITPQIDKDGNNMLHLVGKFEPTKQLPKSGVVLQMQREISWYKEVEEMIPRSYRQRKNNDDLTPYELFTETHVKLASKSEAWLKNAAAQCMVVAALIATVVFAAAFTIPGGYNQTTGLPMFLYGRWFMAFVISDIVSLVLASTSILIFLSFLFPCYTQEDFFYIVPGKLMIGLVTLFLSIASMMIAFSVSFSVLYQKNLIWVPILTSVLCVIPIYFFATFQYPILKDMFLSINSFYLFRSRKIRLYAGY